LEFTNAVRDAQFASRGTSGFLDIQTLKFDQLDCTFFWSKPEGFLYESTKVKELNAFFTKKKIHVDQYQEAGDRSAFVFAKRSCQSFSGTNI
jgi:hypothetical protein